MPSVAKCIPEGNDARKVRSRRRRGLIKVIFCNTWQDLEDRNITFTDELDFEITELAIIYKANEADDC